MSSYHYKILMFAVMAVFMATGHAQFEPPAAIDGATDGDHIGTGMALATTIVRSVVMIVMALMVVLTLRAMTHKFYEAYQGKMGANYTDCAAPGAVGAAITIAGMFFYNWFDEKQLAQFVGT